MIEENKKRGDSGIIQNIWLEKKTFVSVADASPRRPANNQIDGVCILSAQIVIKLSRGDSTLTSCMRTNAKRWLVGLHVCPRSERTRRTKFFRGSPARSRYIFLGSIKNSSTGDRYDSDESKFIPSNSVSISMLKTVLNSNNEPLLFPKFSRIVSRRVAGGW